MYSDKHSNSVYNCNDKGDNTNKNKKKLNSNIIASILDTSYVNNNKQNKDLVNVINKIINDDNIP